MSKYHDWKFDYQRKVKHVNPTVWRRFLTTRDALKKAGFSTNYSWLVGALDAGPAHAEDREQIQEYLEKEGLPEQPQFHRLKLRLEQEFTPPTTGEAASDQPAPVVDSPEHPPSVGSTDAPARVLAPDPDGPEVFDHEKSKLKPDEAIRWAFANKHRDELVLPEHAPSLETWNHIQEVRRDPTGWMRSVYAKVIPSQAKINADAGAHEDRKILRSIDLVEQAAIRARITKPIDVVIFQTEGEPGYSCRLIDDKSKRTIEAQEGFSSKDDAITWAVERIKEFLVEPEPMDVGSILG